MTAPVLNCLTERLPTLEITVRSAASSAKLREHIRAPFRHIDASFDIGMAMSDALTVDAARSLSYYREIHTDWDQTVDRASRDLAALSPSIVLSNVPYVTLAAAQRARIPAAALCCLHWADIFQHYCGREPGAAAIHAQIHAAYDSARPFICPVPRMPMPGLTNLAQIPPIGRTATVRRAELRDRLGLPADARLALMSLGGFGFDLDVSRWPGLGGWKILSGMALTGRHPDVISVDGLPMSYIDVFGSVDGVITKLGYGTVAEAGINVIPVLYVPRDGWPEEPCLAQWLEDNGRCRRIATDALLDGAFVRDLDRLLLQPAPARPAPAGAAAAASILERMLLDA